MFRKRLLKNSIFSKAAIALTVAGIVTASSLTPALAATSRATMSWKEVSQTINSSNQYVYNGNQFDFSLSGRLLPAADGWGYVENGKVNTSKSGVFHSVNGWYLVTNGWVDFNTSGIKWIDGDNYYSFDHGKWVLTDNLVLSYGGTRWYVKDGKIDKSFNGFAANAEGIWKITNGQVDTSYTNVVNNPGGFASNGVYLYFKNGQFQPNAETIANNENGWWVIRNGQVDFSANGVFKKIKTENETSDSWWYCEGGKVIFTYNGAALNGNGIWYISGGKVDFNYNGIAYGFNFSGGHAQN